MSSTPLQSCTHTTMGHLFFHVLCPAQSLITRVTTVVFGGLLLIGGLFAYSAISKYFSTSSIPEYPEIGQKAIQSTLDSLKDHPEITPRQIAVGIRTASDTYQPVNPQIALLASLYKIHFKTLVEAMKPYEENRWNQNPWDQQEVIQAADALMKTAYTISCLTLEDLKPFTERLKGGEDERTYAQALTMCDSYQHSTFYACPNVYHWVRQGLVWTGVEHIGSTDAHDQLFYTEGTLQNSWNQMYNDYCEQVRSYVKEEDLRNEYSIYFDSIVKDTRVESYVSHPSTHEL